MSSQKFKPGDRIKFHPGWQNFPTFGVVEKVEGERITAKLDNIHGKAIFDANQLTPAAK